MRLLPRLFLLPRLLTAAALAGCGGAAEAETDIEPVATVEVAVARRGVIAETVEAFGTVVAAPGAGRALSVAYESTVEAVYASVGQTVAAGAPLVRLRPSPSAVADLATARTALLSARAALQAVRERYDLHLATQDELVAQQGAVAAAEADVARFSANRGALLTAPAAGVVTSVDVSQGGIAAPGAPLVSLSSTGHVEVRLGVDPAEASRLRAGQRVTLDVDGAPVAGVVRTVARVVSADTRLVDVFVRPTQGSALLLLGRLRPGHPRRGRHGRHRPAPPRARARRRRVRRLHRPERPRRSAPGAHGRGDRQPRRGARRHRAGRQRRRARRLRTLGRDARRTRARRRAGGRGRRGTVNTLPRPPSLLALWTARHRRSVVFIALALVVGGVLTGLRLPVALFPNVAFPRVVVSLEAGDRPADETVALVTLPVEEVLRAVPGVENLRSTTSRGSAEVSVTLGWGDDMVAATLQIQAAVAGVLPALPDGTAFEVRRMDPTVFPVLAYSLISPRRSDAELYSLAAFTLRPRLSTVPGVARVDVVGGAPEELHVVVDPDALARYDLTLSDVAEALSAASVVRAAGIAEDTYKQYLVLTDTRATTPEAIGRTVLHTGRARPRPPLQHRHRPPRRRAAAHRRDRRRAPRGALPGVPAARRQHRPDRRRHQGGARRLADRALPPGRARRQLVRPERTHHRLGDERARRRVHRRRAGDARAAAVPARPADHADRGARGAGGARRHRAGAGPARAELQHHDARRHGRGGRAHHRRRDRDGRARRAPPAKRRPATARGVLAAAAEFTRPLVGSSLATIVVFAPLAFLVRRHRRVLPGALAHDGGRLVVSFFVAWLVVPLLAERLLRAAGTAEARRPALERASGIGYARGMRRLLARPALVLLGLVVPLVAVGCDRLPAHRLRLHARRSTKAASSSTTRPPGTSLAETDRRAPPGRGAPRGHARGADLLAPHGPAARRRPHGSQRGRLLRPPQAPAPPRHRGRHGRGARRASRPRCPAWRSSWSSSWKT